MSVAEAIAELRRQTRADNPWEEADFHDRPRLCAELAAILNAAVSGELIPACDLGMEDCPACGGSGQQLGDGGDPGLCRECKGDTVVIREKIPATDARLADTDALAEVQKLREDRDKGARDYCALMEWHDAEFARAEAAEGEVARLRDALDQVADSRKLASHGDPGVLRDFARAAIGGVE